MRDLTFNELRMANVERIHNDKYTECESQWTTAHWLQAMVGEVGELANVLKKIDRGDYDYENEIGLKYHDPTEWAGIRKQIRHELADIQTYLDILAFKLDVHLGEATVEKFNIVSDRIGSDVKL